MTADPDHRPSELNWAPCNCGSPSCTRLRPTNLGMFYQGSGFEPHEVEWLTKAWAALIASESVKAEVA